MTRFIQYQSVPLVIKAIPWRRIDWHGYRYFYSDIFDVISKMIKSQWCVLVRIGGIIYLKGRVRGTRG